MKIASYNIMSGGFNDYNFNSLKPQRLDLLKKAIKEIDADFIGLIDTFKWKDIFRQQDLKKLFNYKKVFHINMDDVRVDKKIGLTVLTNFLNVKFKKVSLITRNCIQAELKFPHNKTLDIFTIYLDDLSEDARLEQIQTLFNKINPNPTIIMGDFNAINPKDIKQSKDNFKRFLKINPDFKKRKDFNSYFKPSFSNMLRVDVIPLILAKGLLDARGENLKDRQPTVFTPLSDLGENGMILTVDHTFCTSEIKTKKFKNYKKNLFKKASDHYPISVEITL